MMKLRWFAILLLFFGGCNQQRELSQFNNRDISLILSKMTDIMVHDITNPPLAARFFSYALLAGYEVVAENTRTFKKRYGVLNDYPDLKRNDSIKGYSYQLSSLLAIMETASQLQPSGYQLAKYEQQFLDSCIAAGFDKDVVENSKKYASLVSKQILAYARKDGYNKTSNYPRYTALNKEGSWYPTPPAYIAAVEPYFNKVRSFTLDSATQFKPIPPVPFSKDKKTGFYKMMMRNYSDSLTQEGKEIAAFWDCNPFAVQDNGHLLMSLKKISPGAHWLGITGIACEKAKKSFNESMLIYTSVSIGLMDGFLCCWDEKYRSNRIRPETAIRKYIDPKWKPLLQTPPFPEYPSGHSVISSASATILSHYFGNNFSYIDSVEVSYGLPPRAFPSFRAAAKEAAISRYYGGIHFTDAIENGLDQGEKIGEWVIRKIK